MIASGKTDVGNRRQINQDYYFQSTDSIGKLPNLFVVADGMGGHNAGDVASRTTVECVKSSIENSKLNDIVSIMEEAIENANKKVFELANSDIAYQGMGTTLVMATIYQDIMYVANIGDSRLYVIDDSIKQITRDHSYVQELVSLGKITKSQARIHQRKNELMKALGVENKISVDFFEVNIEENMTILMCTDGLTNMIEDNEIKDILYEENDISKATERLVKVANDNGGLDNITVLLVRV